MSWVSSAFNGDDDFDLEDYSSKRSSARATMRTKPSGTSGARRSMRGSLSELRVNRAMAIKLAFICVKFSVV